VPTVCLQKEKNGEKIRINVKEEYAAAVKRLGLREGDLGLLKGSSVKGVIVGKALYEKTLDLRAAMEAVR
jgi:phosphoribosylformimino-5-aminoimidazole carboxamide ribonucleotide (ProFAR) isomerase